MRHEEVDAFQKHGHAVFRRLIPVDLVLKLREAVGMAMGAKELEAKRHALRLAFGTDLGDLNTVAPQEVDRLYSKHLQDEEGMAPFLQYFNLWRESDMLRQIALAFGAVVGALLATHKVQLYGDALFRKRPGDDLTTWHFDSANVPLDTESFLTLWIPLQPVSAVEEGGSPLIFADGSQLWDLVEEEEHQDGPSGPAVHGRKVGAEELKVRDYAPLELGDVTAHSGRTWHAAPALHREDGIGERWALAVSYFASGATRAPSLAEQDDDEEEVEEMDSYKAWADEIPIGTEARHHLLPEVPVPVPLQIFPGEGLTSLACAEQSQPEGHDGSDTSPSRRDLYRARLLQDWGHFEEAELLWGKLLESFDVQMGPKHPDTLTVVGNLGQLLHEQGRSKEAKNFCLRAYRGLVDLLGPTHPETLDSALNLLEVMQETEKRSEVERFCRQVLRDCEDELGPKHEASVSWAEMLDELRQARRRPNTTRSCI